MATRSPLAKLTRPRLYDALPRPRLFSLIDEAAKRPIVWLCAPPGSGKSTLIASFLEARNLQYVWYQADMGDTDPATFVHYMRTAAQQVAGKAAAALPAFTPEPQQDLARFARSFFRDFFSVLPNPCAVVFDNFQEMRAAPEGRAAFAQGLEEIPEGITVIVVSRTDPPPEFARLVASGRIMRIDEEELRCTANEAEAILGNAHLDRQVLQRVQQQSQGWVAALVLVREHLSRRGTMLDESLGEGKQAIFHYFAGEIFGGARAENQRILMLTAIPPSITPSEAVALTANEEAPRLLEYLSRRHLFTDRRRGEQPTYQFHGLFREFLLEELRKRVPSDERRVAAVRAAELLAQRGQVSEALALFRDAGEWEAMRLLIRAHALEWARQGRAQALSDWIEALPSTMRENDAWLEYWSGRAWIFLEPQRGRPRLERAFAAFLADGDVRGQALALSTIVTGYYYEWANFAPLDRWLPEFERLAGGEAVKELDCESELRVRAAWLIALLFRRPGDENLPRCAQRLDELIDGESDLNLRVMAASILFNYFNWTQEGESATGLVARVEPILERPQVTPLMQLWWRTHLSYWHYLNGRYRESTAVIAGARAVAERYGLEVYLFEIDHAEANALVGKGEYAAVKARLEAIERYLPSSRRGDWAYFHHVRSVLQQRLEQFAAAVWDAERALALAREVALPAAQIPHFLLRLAHCRMAAGNVDSGMRALEEAITLSPASERRTFEQLREVLQIDLDIEAGELQRAPERLAAVFAEYRAHRNVMFLRHRSDVAARLANYALMHGIETEFVRTLIERNALVSPSDAGAAWPFRLRVRALGGFELVRDGEPMRFTGKTQQRPLEVLKFVVALGGKDVDSQQLIAALWPDADGAAAKISFDSAVHRLRKLLDIDNALILSAGKLSLERATVWTDLWALDSAIEAAARAVNDGAAASLARAARRVLDPYRGPLLGTDEHPWIIKPREALRARFVRTLVNLGEALEKQRDWSTAIDVYRRGLEADNLAESLYRGLMRALIARGDHAEALNAFRRCRELLSIVLGVKPSDETERLYREIAAGGSPARGS